MATGDESELLQIAAYNEDDVRATRALRDWLVVNRPSGLPWRAVEILVEADAPELDEQVAALHAFGADTPEHLLGDVLGYWRREWLALPRAAARHESRRSRSAPRPSRGLAGLVPVGIVERLGATGKVLEARDAVLATTAGRRGVPRRRQRPVCGGLTDPRTTAALPRWTSTPECWT